jgi:hypothetical protein
MSPFKTMVAGSIPLSFDVVARPVVLPPESKTLWCPECQAPMDRHQPDENQPTLLLGTCLLCSKWFLLIEIEDVSGLTLLVELPSADRIREIVEASHSPVS